jgi:hypothetical protein
MFLSDEYYNYRLSSILKYDWKMKSFYKDVYNNVIKYDKPQPPMWWGAGDKNEMNTMYNKFFNCTGVDYYKILNSLSWSIRETGQIMVSPVDRIISCPVFVYDDDTEMLLSFQFEIDNNETLKNFKESNDLSDENAVFKKEKIDTHGNILDVTCWVKDHSWVCIEPNRPKKQNSVSIGYYKNVDKLLPRWNSRIEKKMNQEELEEAFN